MDPTVAEVGGEVEVDEGDVAGGRAHRDVLGLDVAVREARDGVHRVERRRELREVDAARRYARRSQAPGHIEDTRCASHPPTGDDDGAR